MRGWRDKPYTKGRECFTAWGARKASDGRWQLNWVLWRRKDFISTQMTFKKGLECERMW